MTTDERTANVLGHVESRFIDKAQSLKSDCRELIRRLETAMQNCDAAIEGKPYSINSLGEVQSLGGSIDRACAELALLSSMVGLARYAANGQK